MRTKKVYICSQKLVTECHLPPEQVTWHWFIRTTINRTVEHTSGKTETLLVPVHNIVHFKSILKSSISRVWVQYNTSTVPVSVPVGPGPVQYKYRPLWIGSLRVRSRLRTHHDDGVGDGGAVDRPGGHETGHHRDGRRVSSHASDQCEDAAAQSGPRPLSHMTSHPLGHMAPCWPQRQLLRTQVGTKLR